jgi:RNA polymerase sigma-70 factor (ECF subfamily)
VDYSSLSDKTIFLLIARAQPGALAELYDRYSRMVYSLALSLVGDRATAEEITLDVFTRAWQKADTYRPDLAKVSTWLIAITRNHSIDILRRRGVRPEHRSEAWTSMSSFPDLEENNPEQVAELTFRQQRVRAAVAQLPQDQKQVLGLAYFAGYTHRQIAEELGLPLGTVKTRIRLAVQKLRKLLQDE